MDNSIRFFIRNGSKLLIPYLFILSFYFLYRGHNSPGGGFIGGGLIGLASIVNVWLVQTGKKQWVWGLFVIGLLFLIVSCLGGVCAGSYFFKALWIHIGKCHIGTPLLFDIGVFLIVWASIWLMGQEILQEEGGIEC